MIVKGYFLLSSVTIYPMRRFLRVALGAATLLTLVTTLLPPASARAVPPAPANLPATVTGLIFNDANADRLRSDGEPGLEGVEIAIGDTNGAIITGTTAASGVYTLSVAFSGAVLVTVNRATLPGCIAGECPPWVRTTADDATVVTVTEGETATAPAFGYKPGSQLSIDVEGPRAAQIGESVIFTITVFNGGDGFAQEVELAAYFADGLEPVAVTGACSALPCSLAGLPSGASAEIVARATLGAEAGTQVTTTVTARSSEWRQLPEELQNAYDTAAIQVGLDPDIVFESFTATALGNNIIVNWQVPPEYAGYIYSVVRGHTADRLQAQTIPSDQVQSYGGQGNSDVIYNFTDEEVFPDMVYHYWLVVSDARGNEWRVSQPAVVRAVATSRIYLPLTKQN
jgi:hypothetical protein